MSRDIVIGAEKTGVPMRWWRCGRIVYINIKNNRIGCRNTKCKGYLVGSKHISSDSEILQQFIQ